MGGWSQRTQSSIRIFGLTRIHNAAVTTLQHAASYEQEQKRSKN